MAVSAFFIASGLIPFFLPPNLPRARAAASPALVGVFVTDGRKIHFSNEQISRRRCGLKPYKSAQL
ncbi:MAG: hypothetical protein ACJASM_001960 [Salibacteraceae bacterium]|jgi:hypothetical protein